MEEVHKKKIDIMRFTHIDVNFMSDMKVIKIAQKYFL